MKIAILTPGTGEFFCGSCLRDHALAQGLQERGHSAVMFPLYLPLVTDEVLLPSKEYTKQTIYFGAIRSYLLQKTRWFKYIPTALTRWLDNPRLLKRVAKRAGSTSPHELGQLTQASLQLEDSGQLKALDSLFAHLHNQFKPDVIMLSNALLSGFIGPLKSLFNVPVVVSLQGEDCFLDTLHEPYRSQCWQLMGERLNQANHIIGISQYYRDCLSRRMPMNEEKVSIIHNGINAKQWPTPHSRSNSEPFTIGYMAQLIAGKGLGEFIEAFIHMANTDSNSRLRIMGSIPPGGEMYVNLCKDSLSAAKLDHRVTWHSDISFDEKRKLLGTCSILSVPAMYGEAFGLYLLEAWACGIPVVQPRSGAFEELIEASGAGILVDTADAAALSDGWHALRQDSALRTQLGAKGRAAVETLFSHEHMAQQVEHLLNTCIERH